MFNNYYTGNLDKDLEWVNQILVSDELDKIGKRIGYGACQQIIQDGYYNKLYSERLMRIAVIYGEMKTCQILQILWAKHLRECGVPTMGALGPN